MVAGGEPGDGDGELLSFAFTPVLNSSSTSMRTATSEKYFSPTCTLPPSLPYVGEDPVAISSGLHSYSDSAFTESVVDPPLVLELVLGELGCGEGGRDARCGWRSRKWTYSMMSSYNTRNHWRHV